MVNLTIDGRAVSVPEGTLLLDAARKIGVNIPTLCFLREVNEISACRICSVEIADSEKLVAACSTPVQEGMEVFTSSQRVLEARATNLMLILSQHNSNCAFCGRSGNCTLQTLAEDYNLRSMGFDQKPAEPDWDLHYPLIRDASRCINCMRCVSVCEKVQGMRVWDVSGTGARMKVDVRDGLDLFDTNCTLCGQCITHCPVGALSARTDSKALIRRLTGQHGDKVYVAQVAPAVRSAWGEDLGLSREEASVGRMAAALRALGFDYVFDTDFSADLTIMEEGSEFLERLQHREQYRWPMFTSCCPGWVRFVKSEYPDYIPNLSTAKSPQQMFGAVTKSYFAEKLGVDPENIVCVSFMPCTAKKYECAVPEVNDAAARDVDMVITTRELARMLRRYRIDARALPEEDFDSPLGEGSGAGVIFGTTGGVMEAALRSAYFLATGENPDPDAFRAVRGLEGVRSATFELPGVKVRTAVANGLANARRLMEAIRRGEAEYDFVEIMACPTGCAGGGGQPIREQQELGGERGELLRRLDRDAPLRFSHENASVQALYCEYLEAPLSHRAHELLHTDVSRWSSRVGR